METLLKIKKLHHNAIIPHRATAGSAGYDLSACMESPFVLKKGCRTLVSTGIAVQLPPGTVGLVFIRSSLGAKHGLALSNSVGVIDEDYRGEIKIGLTNLSGEDYTIQLGERLAQLVVVPAYYPQTLEVQSLDETDRGAGGFGSTGKL